MNDTRYQRMLELANELGKLLTEEWPADPLTDRDADRLGIGYPDENEATGTGPGAVPHDSVTEIADAYLMILAEIQTWWLNAGSEREGTLENEKLKEALEEELHGWCGPKHYGEVKVR